MLLRSGVKIIDATLVNTQLKYWKQRCLDHLDKLQFMEPENPIHGRCRTVIAKYHAIMLESAYETDNPYFNETKITRTAIQVDEDLLPELVELYQLLVTCEYPDHICHCISLQNLNYDCPICLEPFTTGDIVQSCQGDKPHYCHRQCLVKWVVSECGGDKCPLCRDKIQHAHLCKTI